MRTAFFWENRRNFLRLDYKKFSRGGFFLFFELGLKCVSSVSILHYWLSQWCLVFVLLLFDTILWDGSGNCEVLKFQGTETLPGLFQDFLDGHIKP